MKQPYQPLNVLSEASISFELTNEDLEAIASHLAVIKPHQIKVSKNGFSIQNAPVPKSRF